MLPVSVGNSAVRTRERRPAVNPTNGHSIGYNFLDRVALRFGAGRIERILAEQTLSSRATAGAFPMEAPVLLPSPQTQPGLNMDLAEVLSPSQANAYLECTAKWFFKYFRNLPDSIDAKRARGLAVHKALLEGNFRQKSDSKKDLEREAVLEIYGAAWKEQAEKARFAEDDDKEEFERSGAILVQKYLVGRFAHENTRTSHRNAIVCGQRLARPMLPRPFRVLILFLVVASLAPGQADRVLTNDDIRRMVLWESEEGSVIEVIQTTKSDFDCSAAELLALHSAGVSQRVLRAMLSAASRGEQPPTSLPDEVGIYVKSDRTWVEVQAEDVKWDSWTNWFRRGSLSGLVTTPRSSLVVRSPAEFLILTPMGMTAADYGLLRGRAERGQRRFSLKVNVRSSGDFYWNDRQKGTVEFDAERLSPHRYRIQLNLERGEYAFVKPGLLFERRSIRDTTSANGELCTFRMIP